VHNLSNIYELSNNDLKERMVGRNFQGFRSEQIRHWLYERGILDFNLMVDLPAELRNLLRMEYRIGSLDMLSVIKSRDGTQKRAYTLHDGQIIEAVLMQYRDGRKTACISSQAGCAMGCTFCATGQMGFARNLTSVEIFEQVQAFSAELRSRKERLSNVVFMGMGEPLLNYKNVMEAIRRINEELGIGARHITVSTAGVAPRIRKLAMSGIQVGLAVSLHQTSDAKRSALMPINQKYPIAELLDACRYYIDQTGRRVTFEWALIQDQTDSEQTAAELGALLRGVLCHVNVIPLNATAGFSGCASDKVRLMVLCIYICMGLPQRCL
jgi:23S rRNA (adenine2503-C2)-methyltransferase